MAGVILGPESPVVRFLKETGPDRTPLCGQTGPKRTQTGLESGPKPDFTDGGSDECESIGNDERKRFNAGLPHGGSLATPTSGTLKNNDLRQVFSIPNWKTEESDVYSMTYTLRITVPALGKWVFRGINRSVSALQWGLRTSLLQAFRRDARAFWGQIWGQLLALLHVRPSQPRLYAGNSVEGTTTEVSK